MSNILLIEYIQNCLDLCRKKKKIDSSVDTCTSSDDTENDGEGHQAPRKVVVLIVMLYIYFRLTFNLFVLAGW